MTSFGINNKGSLIFDYYHEDYDNEVLGSHNSTLDQTDVYNGKDSVLWVNFAEAFAPEIQQTYGAWRSGSEPLLSYDKIIENFITNHSDKWSISIYNEDAEYKYISMYRNGEPKGDENLYQVRGTGEEHLKYFVKNRLMYCDSKWKTGDFVNKDTNTIIMRINSPDVSDPNLTPSSLIKYKTFSNMYAGVGYGAKSGVSHHKYVERGKEVSFIDNETSGQNDLDTYIFGANEISSLDDLSRLYCGAINVSAASKLTKLTIGNDNKNYKNNLLTTLSLSNNRLLRELNICNCTALQGTIDLSLCPDIQKIYAKGSGISGVQLPASGFLKEITLPATISNLAITKQKRITRFECEGYSNITTLRIDDSTMAIEQEDGTMKSTDRFPLQEILLGCDINNLVSVNITNTKWNVTSEDVLRTIITKLSQKQGFVLEGSVYLPSGITVSDSLKILIHQKFPNLNVIDANPIFYVDYYNYDNTLWDTETVRAGNNAQGPSKGKPEDIIQDDQGLRHLFVEWENLPTNVDKNCSVGAIWQTKYAVTFYNYDNSKIGQPLWYNANEKPEDPIVLGAMSTPTRPSNSVDLRYAFNGWDGLPDKVVGPANVYATFIEQYPVRFYNGNSLHEEQWVIKGQDATRPANNPEKASTAEFSYTFTGWDIDFTNIQGPTDVHATYQANKRSYSIYFYNPGEVDSNGQLVEKYKTTVLYGSTVTYRGDQNIIKYGVDSEEVNKYEFAGWTPSLTIPITGETKYYAVFKFTAELDDDWETIANNTALAKQNDGYLLVSTVTHETEGKYYIKQTSGYQEVLLPDNYVDGTEYYMHISDYYPLGSRKSTTFTLDGKEVTAEMEIIAHEHDYLNENGSDRAMLTFFCRSLPDIVKNMHSTAWNGSGAGGNIGGYPASDIRNNFLNDTLYNALDDTLKNSIKPVYKYSDGGYLNKKIIQTQDYCWLASYDEVLTANYTYKVSGQGEYYSQAFMDDPITKKKGPQKFLYGSAETSEYAAAWWLRSSYCDSGYSYLYVRSDGKGVYMANASTGSEHIAFGFCI